jgi:hypothetical protein
MGGADGVYQTDIYPCRWKIHQTTNRSTLGVSANRSPVKQPKPLKNKKKYKSYQYALDRIGLYSGVVNGITSDAALKAMMVILR